MIRLDITKKTFEKNLLSYGYNYKIKQYDDFIDSIRRIILNKIENSSNLAETIFSIFKEEPSILITIDKTKINFIKKDFFFQLIDEGIFDLYLDNKVIKYTEKQLKSAYMLKLLTDQDNQLAPIISSINYLFGKNTLFNISVKKALKDGLFIEDTNMKALFYKNLYDNTPCYFSNRYGLFDSFSYIDLDKLIIEKMNEENFEFASDTNKRFVLHQDITNILNELNVIYPYSQLNELVFSFVFVKNNLNDIQSILPNTVSISYSNEKKVAKLINKLINLKDLSKDTYLEVYNDVDSIKINIEDILS